MRAVGRQSRATGVALVDALRRPWIALTAIGLLVVPVTLAVAGIVELRLSADGLHVSRASIVGSGAGPRIAGGWRGQISDIEFGEFRGALSNQIDATLNRRGDTVWVEGHFVTDSVVGGRYVGGATFVGIGTVTAGEFLRLPFEIKKLGARGSGVMLLQISPNGKEADGYALYPRTNPANGRMGFGRATFKRED